jgi:hypothetical protein
VSGDDLFLSLLVGLVALAALGWIRAARAKWFAPGGPSKHGLLRLLAANLIIGVVLLGGAFLGFEIYFRFIYDATDALSLSNATLAWQRRHIHMNNFGMWDDADYRAEPPPGKRRILFLGDSFTAGHGVPRLEDHFPMILRARHPEWEVMTLAWFGWETGHEIKALEMAREKGVRLGEVILVYCMNDIGDLIPEWQARNKLLNERFSNLGFVLDHSYFLNMYYFRSFARRDAVLEEYYAQLSNAYESPVWEKQKVRLLDLVASVRAQGGRPMVAVFPYLDRLAEGPGSFAEPRNALRALFEGAGVPFLDLFSILSAHRDEALTVNRWDSHPSARAHRLAADAIEIMLSRTP